MYLECNQLAVELLGRGFAWLDTGTPDSLLEAAQYVAVIQKRQGYRIACLEEIAWRQGWLGDAALDRAPDQMKNNDYGRYVKQLRQTDG